MKASTTRAAAQKAKWSAADARFLAAHPEIAERIAEQARTRKASGD